ncbi:YcaO-like family protein [Halohasta salina]|uniref:YcaO-like family protein n=1 Tax=Halohasta salina TaxID=2961621 RepID=UPI0020A5FFD4|nr:YcaO-like family protein [Halohasta salina]
MSEVDGITITDTSGHAEGDRAETETDLARLRRIADPTTGIITGVRRVPVPPDEPTIESYVVERADFEPLTDGTAMPHEEGGCGFSREVALVATYGEAIERYCGCLYRQDAFRTASYVDLSKAVRESAPKSAVDPTDIVSFSAQQRASMAGSASLCGTDDELSWTVGEDLDSGADTYVPAQLVYLSYPTSAEPFVRNPISTGLAAGPSRPMAIRNGLCELVERDAFMIWYLNETELPIVDLDTAPPRLRRLANRVTAQGLELTVLDATTDLGVPVAIAILVDRSGGPAVTVAAAADPAAAAAIEGALEEAIQTRLWGIHNIDSMGRSPEELTPDEITSFEDRGLFWSVQERIADLDFWIESSRSTTVGEFEAADLGATDLVEQVIAAGYDCYAVDVTTRDIAALGFTVQRVIALRLQPLYLLERLRYFGGERLYRTPVEMGYRDTQPTAESLNTVPHPFP